MRLLHSTKLHFKFFFDKNCPPYYILSHTWVENETSFQEFSSRKWPVNGAGEGSDANAGVEKVLAFCRYAAKEGCEWVWVDTCCINKESSAELSEAINSMYRWYQDSQKCVVYLPDVDVDKDPLSMMKSSRWFTRGWTLQELLAPRVCLLVDFGWRSVGTRRVLAPELSAITGISLGILTSTDPHEAILTQPVATRLSWAAKRVTTRPEDIAYSLLGLLNLNMSLLYGEGGAAFTRLQRKLAKYSVDETLFVWPKYIGSADDDCCGVFAPHPAAFEGADWIRPISGACRPVIPVNRGLEIRVFNSLSSEAPDGTRQAVPFNCVSKSGLLIEVPVVKNQGRWFRDSKRELQLTGSVADSMRLWEPSMQPSEFMVYLEGSNDEPHRKLSVSSVPDPSDPPAHMFLRFTDQPVDILSLLMSIEYTQLATLTEPVKDSHPEVRTVYKRVMEFMRQKQGNPSGNDPIDKVATYHYKRYSMTKNRTAR